MTKHQTTESLWTDLEPNTLISKTEVPAQANELARTVDNWFSDYKEYIDPFNWEQVDKEYFRTKSFLELSGYLLNAHGVAGEQPLPEIHQLIIDRVNDRRFGHLLLRSPRKLHYFYLPLVYTSYVNGLEEKIESQLEKYVNLGAFWEVERVQYRQQEYCFIFKCFTQLFGYTQEVYEPEAALENSLLDNQPNVLRSNLPDAYCLTHDVIFYNNHLGIFPDAFPDEPAPYDISDLLQGLILRYMAEDNSDIVLELVLSGVLQRQISRQMVQLVLSWILEKVDKCGYVPGPEQSKTAMVNKMVVNEESLNIGKDKESDNKWDYESKHEERWGENFHTNAVAGMTARLIARDWDELDKQPNDHSLKDQSHRRDVMRLGQLLKSLANYDLKKGAQQMKELSDSPVLAEYETVTQDAIRFLKDQRTLKGEFGYWAKEEIMYNNAGHSPDSFRTNLVRPISKACQEALEVIDLHQSTPR